MTWDALIEKGKEDLLKSSRALEYVCGYRKIDQDTLKEHLVGLISPRDLLSVQEFPESLVQPLLGQNREWLAFFLQDIQGRPLGVEFRSIDGRNFYKMYLPLSKVHPPFFGLPRALPLIYEYGEVAIVEGTFDLLSFACITHYPVIAFLTKFPTRIQERFLLRWLKRVRMFLDNDRDGHSACERLGRRVQKTGVHFSNSHWWEATTVESTRKDLNELHQQQGIHSLRFAVEHGLRA